MPKNQRWWLTTDSQEILVRATPEAVYDMVADLPRMGEWSPECQAVEWEGGATGPAEGARSWGTTVAGRPISCSGPGTDACCRRERGREFCFVTEEGGRESTRWHYCFEASTAGRSVTETYDITWLPTWARIVDVPTNRHRELLEGMRHTLEQLKQAAEGAGNEVGLR